MAVLDRNSVKSTSLHHIDIEKNANTKFPADLNNRELEVYLETLLREINEKEQKRLFLLPLQQTTFKKVANSISKSFDLEENSVGTELAERLLAIEVKTSQKYAHLSKKDDTHVKIGSFLQFTYTDKGCLRYLGVKVEHQVILDQTDFKKRAGLGLTEKIYKAFNVEYNKEGIPTDIYIYDSKSKLTKYWWQEFLELQEKNTDTFNTQKASQEVINKLAILKKSFPQDHTILRNATIAAFKQKETMNYTEFLEKTIKNYKSDDPGFEKAKAPLLQKLEELPQKKGFDTIFNLVPEAVPFRRTTYKLNKDIFLTIKDGIENLESKIWSETTLDGRELVVIESTEAKKFKHKERKL
nr:nucleoid-associated protein [uncultured Pseudomonas sp.]